MNSEEIARLMATYSVSPGIQVTQTGYRLELARTWQIPAGARVLEIGCGQGDMTAVLADLVGPDGRVVGTDIAPPGYGAPVTVGDSARHLLDGPLGDRIEMRYETDALTDDVGTGYDVVVLAHCSWYFASADLLERTLAKARELGSRLCFAEWDPEPRRADQVPHLLAVLAQDRMDETDGNVRAPLTRATLLAALGTAGWQVEQVGDVDTSALQDADWEIAIALKEAPDGLAKELLRQTARESGNVPLPAYALTAR
ncbi:Protein-L-isoaspartate(D-aspartate) O-methyltransferase (PCMT) [Lentzea waywayandensis]|uniref:Protein-L-isoaspartate(D-aspartate) O-methyltransferase (PCMT) n=1 Tax=Lentzea waywayandensis TaxID=84724 RepID=A0A1I6FDD3_9PSEU|nr:class I SAM-dependent methyltransferase [Lentzea waywayandensis]SFR27996.1 Protein-L-isoaspartate(D-aspartate) O-methyltransferase (PCMT) [Lentzea waywayandensis]